MKTLLIIPALLLVGCAAQLHTVNSNTPHTTLKAQVAGRTFELENPKDTSVKGLDISVSTNGTETIHIDELTTTMNPTNISNTGDAMANVVREQGVSMVNGINAAANAAGAFTGAAAKTVAK